MNGQNGLNGGEAEAFDERIEKRVRHGHYPDLRRVTPCDWFYNNPWRRPYLINLVYQEYLRFAAKHAIGSKLLEVGCGAGHMSLELARAGFHVTGIDTSPASIEVAKSVAAENPFRDTFGSLDYAAADFLSFVPTGQYDTICFFGVLHHFEDLDSVLEHVSHCLRNGGRIIAIEPAGDWVTRNDATVVALIRSVLGVFGGWYESRTLPRNESELDEYVSECLNELQELRDRAESPQSPHHHADRGEEMLKALRSRFMELENVPDSCYFSRVGGGKRADRRTGPNAWRVPVPVRPV